MSRTIMSPAMLPLDQIGQYLEKVYGFRKLTDASNDTINVAGIKSDLIAKAATDPESGELISDRDTVNNALRLGGIEASKYLTTEGASGILSDTYAVSINSGNEIKNLRDELYQMKAELAKSGMIKNTECYNGYIDAFKEGNEKYIHEVITVTNSDMSTNQTSFITVEDSSDFMTGEYIVIGTNEPQITKVQDIVSANRINLTSTITGPIPSGTQIFKSYGSYSDGSFVFGKKKDVSVSSQEKYIILNDDAQPILLTKKYTPNSGYCAQINIPSTARGAIRRIGVQARRTGFPGALKCYVVDPTNTGTDIFTLATIEQLKEDGKIIGESDLLYPAQANQAFNELFFNFSNTIVLDKPNYMFLFVQIDADTNNYWELKGLRGKDSIDLQTNSKLFSFDNGAGLRTEDGDLYLVVVTSEVLLNNLEYSKQGLYSCSTKLSSLSKSTRVRAELKVNREGKFKVINNPNTLVPNNARPLNTYNEDNKSYSASLFNTGDLIAIGNQIATVGDSRTDNTSFNLKADTYAPAEAPVYRIGYKVIAKGLKKHFDKMDVNNPIKVKEAVITELPLKAIIEGKEAGKESLSSDRLIFEGELKVEELSGYKLEEFDEIEVQVYCENKGTTTVDLKNSPELAGKIFDITVSTDNTYNTIKE